MRGLDVGDAALDGIADGIVANVDYAFSVKWSPRWVPDGEPHRWTEASADGATRWFVECLRCKRLTAHDSEVEADAWGEQHAAGHS
jgi:hypothetical protein